MEGGDYKSAKEAFVSGMTGSSIAHINLISLVALASVSLYAALRTRLPPSRHIGFLLSCVLLVFPLLLSMTVFAKQPILLSLLLFVPAGILLGFPRRENGTPLPSQQPTSPDTPSMQSSPAERSNKIFPLPALTTYRSHMMLMTVLAILAVDFAVFPRSLAKCETFGVSLMDLGVGSFVFSQGVVSAIPLLKDPAYLTKPVIPKFISVTRKCMPIIFLGLVRVLLVKGTEYPEHESEYGRHWNFFITLALIPILQVLLHPVLLQFPISLVAVLVALLQHTLLTQLGLETYVLSAPRMSLISANKEGIVSLTGYLAIHLLGLCTGTLILPPSPSFFRRRLGTLTSKGSKRRNSDTPVKRGGSGNDKDFNLSAPRDIGKTATELCAYSIVWWTLLGISKVMKIGGQWGADGGVSRRMVNLPYILWVAAFNTSFLLAYLVVLDLGFFPSSSSKKNKSKVLDIPPASPYAAQQTEAVTGKVEGNPPQLLEAINKHSLALFLTANVMTGAINLAIPTMYTSDVRAICILGAYTLAVSAIAWIWSEKEKGKTGPG